MKIGLVILSSIFILIFNPQIANSFSDIEASKIQKVWTSFTNNMLRQDIDGAMKYIATEKKEKYRMAFTLVKDKLPQVFSDREDLNILRIDSAFAEAENTVQENDRKHSYPVIFRKDKTGEWKIVSF